MFNSLFSFYEIFQFSGPRWKNSLTIYHCQPLYNIVCQIRISVIVKKLMQRLKITVVSEEKSNLRPSVYVKVVQILNVTFVFIFLGDSQMTLKTSFGYLKIANQRKFKNRKQKTDIYSPDVFPLFYILF